MAVLPSRSSDSSGTTEAVNEPPSATTAGAAADQELKAKERRAVMLARCEETVSCRGEPAPAKSRAEPTLTPVTTRPWTVTTLASLLLSDTRLDTSTSDTALAAPSRVKSHSTVA